MTGKTSDSQHMVSILHAYTHSCLEWEGMFSEVRRTGLFNSLAKPSQNIVSPPYKMILI